MESSGRLTWTIFPNINLEHSENQYVYALIIWPRLALNLAAKLKYTEMCADVSIDSHHSFGCQSGLQNK